MNLFFSSFFCLGEIEVKKYSSKKRTLAKDKKDVVVPAKKSNDQQVINVVVQIINPPVGDSTIKLNQSTFTGRMTIPAVIYMYIYNIWKIEFQEVLIPNVLEVLIVADPNTKN